MRMSSCLIVLLCSLLLAPSGAAARVRYLTIGTGALTGVYYPVGDAISQIFNSRKQGQDLRLTVESTNGSVFNVNAVMAGDLDLGIVQSDRQFEAYNGTRTWEGRPQEKLRALFSLHLEAVSVVAAVDAGIRSIPDLKGKTVNIGNPGSGQRDNALDILAAAGIDWQKQITPAQLKADATTAALQAGRIDAFFYTVGHPNELITKATDGVRKARFIPLAQPLIDSLVEAHPYYVATVIPARLYPGADNREDVPTIGVRGTLCASVDLPADVVYQIVKEVFENLDALRALHPALTNLSREGMLSGLSAPLHPGAERYFREVGLLAATPRK